MLPKRTIEDGNGVATCELILKLYTKNYSDEKKKCETGSWINAGHMWWATSIWWTKEKGHVRYTPSTTCPHIVTCGYLVSPPL